jgi:replicative DNA helicase
MSAVRTVSAALAALGDEVDLAARRGAYATGFHPLDSVLGGGLEPGGLAVVGGAPGRGKTIVALQWARQVALDGERSIYVCYEHPERTILARLLALEVGELVAASGLDDPLRVDAIRTQLHSLGAGECGLTQLAGVDPILADAVERSRSYADRLVVVPESSQREGVDPFRVLLDTHGDERSVLFVDYLQKVRIGSAAAEDEVRVQRAAECLKDLAVDTGIAVVAVAAADRAGLAGRRVSMHHLRGSSAIAYEADAVIVLNEKLRVVSRAHIAYDTTRHDEFRRLTIFSIEKNRGGEAELDLEFEKDFVHYRFNPTGRFVSERLWREGGTED